MARRKVDRNLFVNGFIAYGFAMLVDLVSSIIASIFIDNEYMNILHLRPLVFITHMVAVFVGVWYLLKRAGDRKIFCAAVVAAAYYLTQIVASMLLFEGLTGGIFWNLIAILIGAVAGILLDIKPKKRVRRRRIR